MRPLDQPWASFLTHPCNYPPFHILCNWSYCDFLQSLWIRSRANLVEINFKNPDQTPKCWKKGCLQSNENTPFSKTSKMCNEYPSCNFSKNWWPKGTFRTTTPKINNLYIILSIENYFFYCSSAKWCSALLCSVHFNIKLQLNAGECAAERCRRTSTQSVSQYTLHSVYHSTQYTVCVPGGEVKALPRIPHFLLLTAQQLDKPDFMPRTTKSLIYLSSG